jgi:hypothetical protein
LRMASTLCILIVYHKTQPPPNWCGLTRGILGSLQRVVLLSVGPLAKRRDFSAEKSRPQNAAGQAYFEKRRPAASSCKIMNVLLVAQYSGAAEAME